MFNEIHFYYDQNMGTYETFELDNLFNSEQTQIDEEENFSFSEKGTNLIY